MCKGHEVGGHGVLHVEAVDTLLLHVRALRGAHQDLYPRRGLRPRRPRPLRQRVPHGKPHAPIRTIPCPRWGPHSPVGKPHVLREAPPPGSGSHTARDPPVSVRDPPHRSGSPQLLARTPLIPVGSRGGAGGLPGALGPSRSACPVPASVSRGSGQV